MPVLLADEELELLAGMQHRDYVTYLQLRTRMDYSNGIVGRSRTICLKMLCEHTEVDGVQGRGGESMTQRQIRGVIERLTTAGLLKPLHTRRGETMIFLMQMAPCDFVRPKKPRLASDSLGQGEVGPVPKEKSADRQAKPRKAQRRARDVHNTDSEPEDRPGLFTACEGEVRQSLRLSVNTYVNKVHGSVTRREQNSSVVISRFEEIRIFLNAYGINTKSTNPKLIEMAGYNDETIEAAIGEALEQRRQEGSTQPLNPGFVLSKCQKITAREADALVAPGVLKAVVQEKAASLGIAPARQGETTRQFAARVKSAQARQHAERVAALLQKYGKPQHDE